MFHRSTVDDIKHRVLEEFKKLSSVTRVVVATSSFEMGLDFPDVSIAVNVSAPRSLESFVQKSGRGGRSIEQSYSVLLWQGSLAKKAMSDSMKKYALATSICRRVLIKEHFEMKLEGQKDVCFELSFDNLTGCRCCDICKVSCNCGFCIVVPWKVSDCREISVPMGIDEEINIMLDDEQRDLLHANLEEYTEMVFLMLIIIYMRCQVVLGKC
eukprot:gene18429-20278_t